LRLSIAIVTYRRATICVETLRLLIPLLDKDDELIVVEQVDDEIRRQNAAESINQLRFLCLEKPSMVRARNAAIQSARGRIVLFVDDDVVPSASLLDAHANAYADPSVGGVAGRILGPTDTDESATDAPAADWMDTNFNMRCRTVVETARGCNMSFRRDLLLKIGGFDPGFRPPFSFREDSDVSFRIREAGYRLIFEPAACLRHLEAKSGGSRGPAKPQSVISSEFWMYRQHFCHYRDNLYFMLKHFHGSERRRYIWRSYRDYVGMSRWPWRLLAKNACFLAALLDGGWTARRSHPPYFEPIDESAADA
jgi:glycosyltransferase involved in cell wall biosynthesis